MTTEEMPAPAGVSIITAENAAPAVPPLPAGRPKALPWDWIARQARAGAFRLRCPADSPDGLIGPYLGEGYCLEPIFPDGRALRWFDPTIPADDGDFVLVELSEDLVAEIVAKNRHKPGFLETYGENPSRMATKQLRHYRGEHYICEAEKGIPLAGRGRILGTCTYIMIDGEPVYGSGPNHGGWSEIAADSMPAAQIILNEASGVILRQQTGDGELIFSVEELDTATHLFDGGVNQDIALTDPFSVFGHNVYLTLDYEIRRISGTGSIFVHIFFRENGGPFIAVAPVHAGGNSPSAEYDIASLPAMFEQRVHSLDFVNGIEPDSLPCVFVRCANAPNGETPTTLEFKAQLAGSVGQEVEVRNTRLRVDVVMEK